MPARVVRITRNRFRVVRSIAHIVDATARAEISALETKVDDPRRLVAALNWDVNPSQLSGRTADDFERTFRAQFDTPYIILTHLYFEVWIADPAGAAQKLHDRAQWKQVTHLDIAVDSIEATNIADTLQADHDHVDVELRFFDDAVSLATRAVTSARVLIVEGGQSQGGTTDNTARAAATAAAKLAMENEDRLDALPSYAADMAVWPPNVEQHSDFQRKFQSTLSGLAPSLATNAGSTGTRFTNTFRIFTRNADGAVVQLHTQGWAFTEDERQTIEWDVNAAEFNRIGTQAATNGLEVWGEFRAVYGGGVDEARGRTNPVFIDFGEQPEWPANRGEVTAIDARLKTAETDIAALEAGELTTVGKIALLSLTSEPSGVAFKTQAELETALRRTTIGISNPELLDGDVWVEGQISGQPALARTKWSSATAALNLDLDAGTAVSVANNIASDRSYPADLVFFAQANGGSELERLRVRIPLVNLKAVVQTNNAATGNVTLKREDGEIADLTLTGALTLNLDTAGGSENGNTLLVRATQDATGGRVLTLHNSIVLDGRSAPVLSTGANERDNLLFIKRGNAWVYLGIITNDGATAAAGGGLTQTQVDARVRALVDDVAEEGNSSRWGYAKLPADVATDSDVSAARAVGTAVGARVTPLEARSPRSVQGLTVAASVPIAWSGSKLRALALTRNVTLTFSGITPGDVMVIRFTQDATGGRTVTWPSAVKWAGGTAPTLSTGANEVDVVTLLAFSASQIVGVIEKDVS